jgi:hypothetical protein
MRPDLAEAGSPPTICLSYPTIGLEGSGNSCETYGAERLTAIELICAGGWFGSVTYDLDFHRGTCPLCFGGSAGEVLHRENNLKEQSPKVRSRPMRRARLVDCQKGFRDLSCHMRKMRMGESFRRQATAGRLNRRRPLRRVSVFSKPPQAQRPSP